MMRLALGLIALSLLGCGGGSDTLDAEQKTETIVIAPLVELSEVVEADDPLVDHRPESVDCNRLTGWYVEDGALEANTGECNYLALAEPAAAAAATGEILRTELSYFDLTASEAAEAHIALLVETEIIWERTIPIPADAAAIELSIKLERAIDKGDQIGIHLHNHGQNTWNLRPLTVERPL